MKYKIKHHLLLAGCVVAVFVGVVLYCIIDGIFALQRTCRKAWDKSKRNFAR